MKKVIGTGVMLQTPEGNYLLQERDHNTNIHPGMIAAFGGGVEGGENAQQCAIREIFEELCLNISIDDLESIKIFESKIRPNLYVHMFIVRGVNPSKLDLQEGASIVELSKLDALKHKKVTDFTKDVLNLL
jgi:8-oxo-dGTP pyrophosphatase MutT (NUDIX family)